MPNIDEQKQNGQSSPEPAAQVHSLGLRTNQLSVFHNPARFRVVVAGRRFGKTQLSLLEMIRAARGRNRRVWYVAPSFDQAKRILWQRLKAVTKPFWTERPTSTDLTVHLRDNSTITLRGSDNPDSLRGNGLDFVVLDEFASMHPDAWHKALRPALTDRNGRALFLGTPQGSNHFYDLYKKAQSDLDWASFQFTTIQGGNVPAEELVAAASDLDADSYRQEFEAAFVGAGQNRVYYAFDPALNVQSNEFDPHLSLIWAIDFNVNPMCMLLMQRSSTSVYVLDEIIVKPSANTDVACDAFHARTRALGVPHLHVELYGDASGNQRRTAGADTDWTLIRQFFSRYPRLYTPSYRLAKSNPAVRDRVNCVNSRLQSAIGEPHVFINPQCRELILDLEKVGWQLDASGRPTSEIDKTDKHRSHTSDALGYYISQAFPLRPLAGPNSSGRII